MRISPLFAKTRYSNVPTTGQSFKKTEHGNSKSCLSEGQNDIFVKLAKASMRDVRIESELKSMGLI